MNGLVAVHSGAGNCINEAKYVKVIKKSCIRAKQILAGGGSVVDACEAAIVCLENNGVTNAGFGSNLTWDGKIECEASLMNGMNLQYGACTNLSNVQNPIRLARIICDRQSKNLAMRRIPPMLLSGEGASTFAQEMGVTLIDTKALMSNKAIKCHEYYKDKVKQFENKYNTHLSALDTVGAICVDSDGNCAAGCSSGGLILKVSGRVGQAATYGAGCWAQKKDDISVATCTTGNGEYLIKTLLAKEIADNLLISACPATSLNQTFKNKFIDSPFLSKQEELFGGALSLHYDTKNRNGEILWSHTTKKFCIGYMTTLQKTPQFLNSALPNNATAGKSVIVSGQTFKFF